MITTFCVSSGNIQRKKIPDSIHHPHPSQVHSCTAITRAQKSVGRICVIVLWAEDKEETAAAAAAAKLLQSCPTLCDPIDGSPLGSPSLGFSRQEHWSGLPFPSPVHESEKWKWSHSVMSDPRWPHRLQPSRLLHPWDFPGKSTGVGCHCLLQGGDCSPSKLYLFW